MEQLHESDERVQHVKLDKISLGTDLVLLLEVPHIRHVQVLIIHLRFTLAAASTTTAEATAAEVATRQKAADPKQGLQ